ncbi:MAG: hypothetical protein LBV49_02075 [Azonexus sp.]|jgi:hypothetical protein|nr:hypothetical protein [Azonexus sp.]
MNDNSPELDLKDFARWLKGRYGEATQAPQTPQNIRDAATATWSNWDRTRRRAEVYTFERLAAADGDGEQKPIELNTPFGSLQFMHQPQSGRWRVVFHCHSDVLQKYRDATPRIRIGSQTLALSAVTPAGISRGTVPEGLGPQDLIAIEMA